MPQVYSTKKGQELVMTTRILSLTTKVVLTTIVCFLALKILNILVFHTSLELLKGLLVILMIEL